MGGGGVAPQLDLRKLVKTDGKTLCFDIQYEVQKDLEDIYSTQE